MPVRVVSLHDIVPEHLPGRDLQWLATPKTIGSEKLSIAIMHCPAKSIVRPMHGHKDTEEILLILEGQGEAWVDGETAPFEQWDTVLFPVNSKHQVRNTGDAPLVTASIFSPPTGPDSYILCEEDAFVHIEN